MSFLIDPAECMDSEGVAVCIHRVLEQTQFVDEYDCINLSRLSKTVSELKKCFKPEASLEDGYVLGPAKEGGEKIVAFVTYYFEGKIAQAYLTPASEWGI